MKPAALLYCQHSLGLGHFVRSLALAEALADQFDLTFINGGPVPEGIGLPNCLRFEHLPPLRMQEDGTLSGDGDVSEIFNIRRRQMLELAMDLVPRLLVVELYPFGRKKFAAELDPLIEMVRTGGGKVACSVRDILVDQRVDQAGHDERAAQCLNRDFDAVLVHADRHFASLETSFAPATPLAIPVHYTGFVAKQAAALPLEPDGPTLVTAGGGIVGHALYRTAIAAQPFLWAERGWSMDLVAGPFFPENDWVDIQCLGKNVPGLRLHRTVTGIATLLAAAGRVVSQSGYNSALEIVQCGRPTLFVPFARGQESEQTNRAHQLAAAGLADWIPEASLDSTALATRILGLTPPKDAAHLDFGGAANSAKLLMELVA